jgi:type I restriction enzyme S subunit
LLIPLPPLEEQKRIVTTANHLMALCDELEESLRQYEADSDQLLGATVRSLLALTVENSSGEVAALITQ